MRIEGQIANVDYLTSAYDPLAYGTVAPSLSVLTNPALSQNTIMLGWGLHRSLFTLSEYRYLLLVSLHGCEPLHCDSVSPIRKVSIRQAYRFLYFIGLGYILSWTDPSRSPEYVKRCFPYQTFLWVSFNQRRLSAWLLCWGRAADCLMPRA